MTGILEDVRDIEKVFAFLAQILTKLDTIAEAAEESNFVIDMYADDPGGTTGVLGTQGRGLNRQYNGPYIITDILVTWAIGGPPTSAILQIGDRTYQFPPLSGIQSLNSLLIEVQRDDVITFTVTPAAACHLEIMGNVKKRSREHT